MPGLAGRSSQTRLSIPVLDDQTQVPPGTATMLYRGATCTSLEKAVDNYSQTFDMHFLRTRDGDLGLDTTYLTPQRENGSPVREVGGV